MKNGTLVLLIFSIALIFIGILVVKNKTPRLIIQTDPVPVQYVGTIKVFQSDSIRIRLLVLKHCKQSMADGDANLAIKAANLAATRGLDITQIGNHYINKDGKWRWSKPVKMERLKDFISEQMKVNAEPGDTLVVFTIGHGFTGGRGLQHLGSRRDVMMAIAGAAEENDQETLWWQLSCYACAGLPKISELNSAQQELLSIVASSDARRSSSAGVQGRHMEKVFLAMAEKSKSIDPDGDDIITAKELSDFLNQAIRNYKGRVFAKSPDEPIFGLLGGVANSIPIRNHEGPQQEFPKRYIPLPQRRD